MWKFSVHVLLKPTLENFEHYFAQCEMNVIVWCLNTDLYYFKTFADVKRKL